MHSLTKEIGQRISALRKEKHITQEQLAEYLDISVKHCSCAERGVSMLSLEKLIELCDILDTDLDYLVRGWTSDTYKRIPPSLVKIFSDADESELQLLKDYTCLYAKIRSLNIIKS